ncbi:6-bladed beta-propeller [Parabacteroides sp. AF17-28]|uniref:6-bladed beta-propeller n=1 Tax=Parabacteroides sp. AF17-28 TaxID=2292241 RepID=UPI000EFDBE59|nr:6-bladed beta-propeller [Parabacteroides sp. AF17-28]RHR62297.1 6-bladed beta-propeller [Parabacteroides sp. AF17-28]
MIYITCILILFAVCSCKKANDDTTKLIVVDVAKDYPQKEIYLQDIADVEYIPLATSDSILVNSSPSIVSDKGIVTRGGKVGEILLFDAKGQELQGRICRRGQGPEEYNAIIFNIVDWKRKEVFIADYTSLKVYDFSGNYLRTLIEEDIMKMNILNLNDDYLLCNKDREDAKSSYHPYFILPKIGGKADTLSIEIPFFIASNRKILWDDGHTNDAHGFIPAVYNCTDRVWLTNPALDTIYQLHPDLTLTPVMIPLAAPTKDPEAPLLYFLGINDRYAWISRMPRHVTVKMSDMSAGREKREKLYMYDRETQEWFTPVYHNRAITTRNTNPIYINLTSVAYGYGMVTLNAMDLVEAYQNNEITDEKLKKIASTMKEEDNPVLMLLKFKDSIRK